MLQNRKFSAERVLLYKQHINTCLGLTHRKKISHEYTYTIKKPHSASLCVSMGSSVLKDNIPNLFLKTVWHR